MLAGISTEKIRAMRSAISASSAFFSSNLASSYADLLNARITRIPESFSRTRWLSRSVSFCRFLKSGFTSFSTNAARPPITGSTEKIYSASRAFMISAITVPPTSSTGAASTIRTMTRIKSCSCFTSLVLRVIRDAAPILSTSHWDRLSTFRKTFSRRIIPYIAASFDVQ